MATNNFHSVSGKYYAFDDNHFWFHDDESGEWFDYGNWSETVSNIQDKLKLSFDKAFNDSDFNINNELRSYPATPIGRIQFVKSYGDYALEMIFHVVMRSGYYSWANVDVYVEYFVNGEWEYDKPEELIWRWWWYGREPSKKQFEYYVKCFTKSCNKAYDAINTKLDKVLTEVTDAKRVKVAQFSNWEAVCQQVK